MTIPVQDRLYQLLPALYRIRDSEPDQGEALRALMALIEQQFLTLEADIDQLYDDAFIETCQEWVVPYIADLLKVRPLQGTGSAYSQRAYVANTLAYRQRKGTATVLEQLARDVTQWPARGVEYFERLQWTQYSNHLRPNSWRTPDFRDTNALELLHTPFETAQYTPEVRHIGSGRGRYNIPNVGLGLWRLQAYPLAKIQARPVPNQDGLYWINPLGRDLLLFNDPVPETEITSLAQEINVPAPLRRRPIYDEVEAVAAGQAPATQYFSRQPVFQIFLEDEALSEAEQMVAPAELLICDLSGEPGSADSSWQRPDTSRRIAIDPELGRLALPQGATLPEAVLVSHAYGFSGDIGGGPYERRESLAQALTRSITWQVGVSREATAVGDGIIVTEIDQAIALWNAQPPGTVGAIALLDNQSYNLTLTELAPLEIPPGSELLIVAADWPVVQSAAPLSIPERRLGQLVPVQRRPHLTGDFIVRGPLIPDTNSNPGRLVLDGLLVEGRLQILPGNLGHLRLAHCTLVPERGGIEGDGTATAEQTNNRLVVTIDHSITGPIYLPETITSLAIADSIVDADQAGRVWFTAPLTLPFPAGELGVVLPDGSERSVALAGGADVSAMQTDLQTALQSLPGLAAVQVAVEGERLLVVSPVVLGFSTTVGNPAIVNRLGVLDGVVAIAAPQAEQTAPDTLLQRTTVFGGSYIKAFQLGSEVIWTGPVVAQRRQTGCIRFSYVPPNSHTPRRYRCQPDLEIDIRLELAQKKKGTALDDTEVNRIYRRTRRQIVPSFTTRNYGDPAYGQLSNACPEQICTGAADGSEMGAFNFLKQPQREANLQTVLDEYLRFGLEAGIFYLT